MTTVLAARSRRPARCWILAIVGTAAGCLVWLALWADVRASGLAAPYAYRVEAPAVMPHAQGTLRPVPTPLITSTTVVSGATPAPSAAASPQPTTTITATVARTPLPTITVTIAPAPPLTPTAATRTPLPTITATVARTPRPTVTATVARTPRPTITVTIAPAPPLTPTAVTRTPLPAAPPTSSVTVSATGSISGQIALQGWSRRGTITLAAAPGSFSATVASATAFQLALAPGAYTMTARSDGFYTAQRTSVIVRAGANTPLAPIVLWRGSITGGALSPADVGLVASAVGRSSGFDPRCDVNGDGEVNILDLALISGNLGKPSVQPWGN